MISEIHLINMLSSRINYDNYREKIADHVLTDEGNVLLKEIGLYWDTFPSHTIIGWPEFATWLLTIRHPTWAPDKKAVYERIITELHACPTGPTTIDILGHFKEIDQLGRLADLTYKRISGEAGVSLGDLHALTDGLVKSSGVSSSVSTDIVTAGLTDLLDTVVRTGGLEWRLEDLNIMVGPVRQGDMIIVGARVETGKTTFLTSEITHMVGQLPPEKKVIFFNNEEAGKKIKLRLYESGLNRSVKDLLKDEAKYEKEYEALLGGDSNRIMVVHPSQGILTKARVEEICREHNPGIIVFNVLHKVRGFEKEATNDTDRIGRLAQWARELAIVYGVVFCVVQADGSAAGQKWINDNQLYMSKTTLPGEADVIITIGKSFDDSEQDYRYIYLPKNKLPGGPKTDPTRKHGKAEVEFDGERGRFKTFIGRST